MCETKSLKLLRHQITRLQKILLYTAKEPQIIYDAQERGAKRIVLNGFGGNGHGKRAGTKTAA